MGRGSSAESRAPNFEIDIIIGLFYRIYHPRPNIRGREISRAPFCDLVLSIRRSNPAQLICNFFKCRLMEEKISQPSLDLITYPRGKLIIDTIVKLLSSEWMWLVVFGLSIYSFFDNLKMLNLKNEETQNQTCKHSSKIRKRKNSMKIYF